MTIEDVKPFLHRLHALFPPLFGQTADEWVIAMAPLVRALDPPPTPARLSALVTQCAKLLGEMPTFREISETYATLPGPRVRELLKDRVTPDMETVTLPDGTTFERPACHACHGNGFMARWRRGGRYVADDTYENQRLWDHRQWSAVRAAALELGAVEMSEWCRCGYGEYRKALDAAEKARDQEHQVGAAARAADRRYGRSRSGGWSKADSGWGDAD